VRDDPAPARVPFESFTLDNGLTVVVVPRHNFPVVSAQLVIDVGGASADDVGGRRAFVASRVYLAPPEGVTGTAVSCGVPYCSVTATAPSDQLTTVLARIGRLVLPASLPREIVDNRLATAARLFEISGGDPSLAVGRNVRAIMFGFHHEYGESTSTQRPTADEVRAFRDRALVPRAATLVLAGDVSAGDARAAVASALGAWPDVGPVTSRPQAPPPPAGPHIVVCPAPNLAQLQGVVAARGPRAADPDAPAFRVLVELLGGGAASEAYRRVREEQAAAYAVGGNIEWFPDASYVFVRGAFDDDKVTGGMKALLDAIAALRDSGPSEADLDRARRTLLSRWRTTTGTATGLATLFAVAPSLGVPLDHVQDLPAQVSAVTREQVRAAAQRYLSQDALRLVFVGEAAYLLDAGRLGFGWPAKTNGFGEPQP
jgi:zinc protease